MLLSSLVLKIPFFLKGWLSECNCYCLSRVTSKWRSMALTYPRSTAVLVLSAHNFGHPRSTNNSLLSSGSLLPLSLRNVIVSLITSPFREPSNYSNINTTNQQTWEWFQNINFQFISSTRLCIATQHRHPLSPLPAELQAPQTTINPYHALLWSCCEWNKRRIHQVVLHSSDLVMHFILGVLDIVSRFQMSPDLHELTLYKRGYLLPAIRELVLATGPTLGGQLTDTSSDMTSCLEEKFFLGILLETHGSHYGHHPQQLLTLPCKILQQHEMAQIHSSFLNNFSLYHTPFYSNINRSDRWNFLQKLLSTLYGISRPQRQPKCTTFPFSTLLMAYNPFPTTLIRWALFSMIWYSRFPGGEVFYSIFVLQITDHEQPLKNHNLIATLETLHREE